MSLRLALEGSLGGLGSYRIPWEGSEELEHRKYIAQKLESTERLQLDMTYRNRSLDLSPSLTFMQIMTQNEASKELIRP